VPVNDQLASDTWTRFRYCIERGHYEFLDKVNRCDNFFVGNQWSQEDLNKLKASRRPALTINKIISTMSTVMGEQIYNRNEISFRPAGDGATSEVADALDIVWQQIAQQNQLSYVRSDVFADGIIRSRGFYDVRMDFASSNKGDVRIELLNSKNVVVDPDAEEYDPDKWNDVFITKWMTYQDIAVLYDDADAEYLKDREESLFPYAYDSIERVRDRFAGPNLMGSYYGIQDKAHVRRNIRVLERQHHVLAPQKHFVDIQSGDMRPIPDHWDRNKIAAVMQAMPDQLAVIKKKIKRIRWTVTADHCVLHDDWSPYRHFTVVPFFPHFHHGRTVGLVENLLSSQELLNKTSSQELHIVNTTANSGWKVKTGNLVGMSLEELENRGAETGLVVEVKEIDGLEKITPNSTPQGMDRISFKAEEHIKTISGVSDSMQGFDREDVAAKAIREKKQSGKANMVKVLDNLGRTDWLLARNTIDLVQEFYTDERVIHVTHQDVLNQSTESTVNQYDPVADHIINDLTMGKYHIIITEAPDRDVIEDAQFEHAKELREMGIQIPDDVLIENSRLKRRSEIVKQMKEAAESPQAQQEQQLKMRNMEATVSKVEGEAKEKHTKSALDTARAQKESIEAQQLAQGGDTAEMRKAQQEMQLEREKHDAELQFKKAELAMKEREHEMELQFKQREHDMDMQLKQQEGQQRLEQQRQAALAQQRKALDADSDTQPGESHE
jgi:hypothetical protein